MNSNPLPLVALLFLVVPSANAQEAMGTGEPEPTAKDLEFFEKTIRPALIKHCYECHSKESGKIKGSLILDTREGSRLGGDSGPAVVPFKVEESLLIAAIRHDDKDLAMPPKYRLDAGLIADFEKWIALGAPDPREAVASGGKAPEYTNTIDIGKGRGHWAYQIPQKPQVPEIPNSAEWTRNAIDAFVAEGHASHGVTPAPDAGPHSLIRRLSFDLTGLPPTPGEVGEFISAYSANADSAIGETVSRLLASEAFGERWGRHWLDVARYAESSGKEVNATYPQAWRYRDYVIDSFNADKPFNEFLIEQIAGDLLPAETDEERAAHLVATGFLALGTKNLNEQNSRQFRFDLVDEQIDTTTQAFLATTAACARCHDHKFDPIPMSDYYALAGIFLSSETLYGTPNGLQSRRATGLIELPPTAPGLPGVGLGGLIELAYQREVLSESVTSLEQQAAEARRNGGDPQAFVGRILQTRNQLGIAEGKLLLYDEDGNARALAMGVRESGDVFDSQILIRGEEDQATAERVPRDVLQVLKTADTKAIPADQSGRLQLAEWMASPENPLTARVLANRVWLWLFGEGLVSSVDNFGTTGEKPSNPALLDYLAVRLIELDWSVKDLIREITASRTYRMASTFDAEDYEKDPENRFFWRANPRRLDAESLRDATLAVSGLLDPERPVGSAVAEAGVGFVGRTIPESTFETDSNHRSVYLPVVRGAVPESLALFDFSDPSLPSGKREITTVPSQALYLMNSPFVIRASEALAKQLTGEMGLRGPELAREAFYRAFSRPPTEVEAAEAKAFVEAFLAKAKAEGLSEPEARLLALTGFCQSLLASAEFRYLN